MTTKLCAIVLIVLCSNCYAGSSLMKYFNDGDLSRDVISKFESALTSNDLSKGKSLIESENININAPDKSGKTLLIKSILSDDYDSAEKLLRLGANPNLHHDKYEGKSAIGWAAQYKNDSYLKLLLQYGADVNLYNSKERTAPYPIYNAIAADRISNLKLLLSSGAKPDVMDKAGLTPLMFAATSGSWEMAFILLEGGADIAIKNKWNEDAALYIENAGLGTSGEANKWRQKVVKLFKDKGVVLNLRVPL